MYEPHLIAENLSYPLFVWFFICIFSSKKYLLSSIILSTLWLLYCAMLSFDLFYAFDYVESKGLLIKIDGVFAIIMTTAILYDRVAIKHALLLSFATFCHIMIILSLKNESYGIFYHHYDELIIMVGLLQMVVSYGGFTTALRNIQRLLHGRHADNNGASKNIPAQKKRKAKT